MFRLAIEQLSKKLFCSTFSWTRTQSNIEKIVSVEGALDFPACELQATEHAEITQGSHKQKCLQQPVHFPSQSSFDFDCREKDPRKETFRQDVVVGGTLVAVLCACEEKKPKSPGKEHKRHRW
ncbi:unnamed protein product [Caenorhabditis sp. 36 PRJEB53466]|nr:unnamed protein product [Caenorhabditis sp. 36 PRJEB53466]